MSIASNQKYQYRFVSGLDSSLKKQLENDFGMSKLDIEDIFTNTQLSKIEQKSDYLYISLQFPEFLKDIRQFTIKEIHTIIFNNQILVIDKDQYKYILQFNNFVATNLEAENSFGFFCEMLDFIITKMTRITPKFYSEIKTIELEIFDFKDNHDLLKEILLVKRNLLYFINILSPIYDTIVELQNKNKNLITSHDMEKIDDSLDKIKKMLNNAQNFLMQMNLLTETNEALIARSTNQTIQVLTAVNIIVIVPTILTGFFGMNVFFGWDPASPDYLPIVFIILITFLATTLAILYFKKKKMI